MHSLTGALSKHRRNAVKKNKREQVPYVYEKMHSPLLSLFLFQMQKKQKGQERFGRHHNTEVTFCAIVEVVLFFSYCPVRIKNEIKAMLMERGGQSPAGADGCWRGDALTCVLPPPPPAAWRAPCIVCSHHNLLREHPCGFCIRPAEPDVNLSHLSLPSNRASC